MYWDEEHFVVFKLYEEVFRALVPVLDRRTSCHSKPPREVDSEETVYFDVEGEMLRELGEVRERVVGSDGTVLFIRRVE